MRGIAISALFGIVLALLVLLFAGIIIFGIGPKDFADQSLCSNTGGALRMFSYFDGVTVASPDDPTGVLSLCPPRIVSIRERERDERIIQRVGDELVICQNSFGGGQVNLFRDEGRGSQTRYCGLCSKIDFEEGSEGLVGGFDEHLATHVVAGTGKTIGQILNSDLPPIEALTGLESGELDGTEVLEETFLDREKDLAILYVYDKKSSIARNGLEAFTYGALGGVGLGAHSSVKVGRAVAAKIAAKTAVSVGARRAIGLAFGPVAAVTLETAIGLGTGLAAVHNSALYTDDWVGGVVMIEWDELLAERDAPAGVDSERSGLSSTLGCDQYINFVEGRT